MGYKVAMGEHKVLKYLCSKQSDFYCDYPISSNSFRGNYSFLNFEIVANSNNVFPQIVFPLTTFGHST